MRSLAMTTLAFVVPVWTACGSSEKTTAIRSTAETTNSAIAIANLDQQITEARDDLGAVAFLLARSRFLADYDALDRANTLAEGRFATHRELVARARARSAVHRFKDALADIAEAERQGASSDEVTAPARRYRSRPKAMDAIPVLEAAVLRDSGLAYEVRARLRCRSSR